jgi:hypothetical protein
LRKVKDLKHKEKFNGERSDGKGKKPMKKQRREEMNQGEEMGEENDNEHIVFALNELLKITFDDSEEGQFFNFDEPDVNNSSEYTPRLIYYDWLADSAMTSHVSNQHEACTTFHPLSLYQNLEMLKLRLKDEVQLN